MTTTAGAGHFGPLRPFADAFLAEGHDVLVAIPERGIEMVRAAGLEAWPLADADPGERGAVFARTAGATHEQANAIVVGELFAGTDARAALPGVLDAIEAFEPDVLVHESCEFAGPLAAEIKGIGSVRVAVGMAALETWFASFAAPEVDALRAVAGLERDPEGERLRTGPALTLTPPAIDGGARAARFREPLRAPAAPDGDPRPLVYLSFGTVAPQMGLYPELYRAAVEQLAPLPARVLLTTGGRDPAEPGPLPTNVRAEPWVREADLLPSAAAMVSHGGAGSVRMALAAGVPLVIVPQFGDQPYNAQAVEAIGAGLALDGVAGLREAVRSVLADAGYARAAAWAAEGVASLPPAGEAIAVLEAARVSSATWMIPTGSS